MVYTLNKRRGQKLSGRGHSKHKSGSKGGTGRAGHRSHKIRPYKVYKKNSRYIKYAQIIKYFEHYKLKGYIVKVEGVTSILSYKFSKKIINVPDSAFKIYGKNVVKYARPKDSN